MKDHIMGIDFGSTTAKTVILNMDGEIVASDVSQLGSVSGAAVEASIAKTLKQAGLTQDQIARTVSTGYGRRLLDIVDKSFTEITCHAKGAITMAPEARMVIDIGGQDSKVIAIDKNGTVENFAMNDRCAGGTGKFFEVLARAMEVDLEEMGRMALEAIEDLSISSMCATFAETEVISLMAEGKPKTEILGAVHRAIAKRTMGLVARVGKRKPVVMTGGVANNIAALKSIEKELGCPLIKPSSPQTAGALGAAVLGLEEYKGLAQNNIIGDEPDLVDPGKVDTPKCKSTSETVRKINIFKH